MWFMCIRCPVVCGFPVLKVAGHILEMAGVWTGLLGPRTANQRPTGRRSTCCVHLGSTVLDCEDPWCSELGVLHLTTRAGPEADGWLGGTSRESEGHRKLKMRQCDTPEGAAGG